jgi:hypothetical protein
MFPGTTVYVPVQMIVFGGGLEPHFVPSGIG